MKHVLIIEDDEDIVDLLAIHLNDLDCRMDKIYDGPAGLELALEKPYDLIILDVMLPGMDGLEVCRQLRARSVPTPILMLTAKAEEIDKVLGLETGADDYLTKPFSVREFISRVKAIFRRVQMIRESLPAEAPKGILRYADLLVDYENHKVIVGENRVGLTPKEFDLLWLLASHPGRSYTRSELLNLVWGYEFSGYEHTVNAHINRLRAKIEKNLADPQYILTTWGIGYRFQDGY
jgi:two-component system, OmpR family, alkaline phosphatase synthesis response regulator PhoP